MDVKKMIDCMKSSGRDAALDALESDTYDLVVIGGGITGAGILREASLRGLSVALLEAEDFASGTSSKSTKLIHGGLRYLAMGHIHVVREAALERKRVHQLAPHLAEPKWLMVPAAGYLEYLKYQVGVSVYEHLGQVAGDDKHFNLTHAELKAFEPTLDTKAFPRACVYREYLTDDARLVMGNIRAGISAGGIALNKLSVTGLLKQGQQVKGVQARCALTGRELNIKARGVINAAGPWVEQVCSMDGVAMPKSMVLSKGVHLVIPWEKLPIQHMIFTVTRDQRPVFAIPRGDVVYIGTTDSVYPDGAKIWPEVLPEEVLYLFEPIARYFGVRLTQADCLTTWAGLRPLIAEQGKSSKEISRKDEVWVSASGLITIAGGKLTGYRKMAEETVDAASRLIDVAIPDQYDDTPLPGGDFSGTIENQALLLTQNAPMVDSKAERLVRLYGTEAVQVVALGPEPLKADGSVLCGEVVWALRHEAAQNLEDILYRRTRAALYLPAEAVAIIDPIADLMAAELGWSETQKVQEIARAKVLLDADLTAVIEAA
ncbi:MAG: glycerol-3-phosphate dehydrogenase [Urechidicola sp.]